MPCLGCFRYGVPLGNDMSYGDPNKPVDWLYADEGQASSNEQREDDAGDIKARLEQVGLELWHNHFTRHLDIKTTYWCSWTQRLSIAPTKTPWTIMDPCAGERGRETAVGTLPSP